VTTFDPLN